MVLGTWSEELLPSFWSERLPRILTTNLSAESNAFTTGMRQSPSLPADPDSGCEHIATRDAMAVRLLPSGRLNHGWEMKDLLAHWHLTLRSCEQKIYMKVSLCRLMSYTAPWGSSVK